MVYARLGWSVQAGREFRCEEDGEQYRVYSKRLDGLPLQLQLD